MASTGVKDLFSRDRNFLFITAIRLLPVSTVENPNIQISLDYNSCLTTIKIPEIQIGKNIL